MSLVPLALAAVAAMQVPGASTDLQERYGARWTPEAAVYQAAAPGVVRLRLEARVRLAASFGPLEVGTGERWVGVSNGTGVIYSEQGLVITNAHVVSTPEEIRPEDLRLRVLLSAAAPGEGPREFPARLLAIDRELDLALLQVDAERSFVRIPFARPGDLLIGEKVIALGAPFGRSLMLSSGILSALDQTVVVEERDGTTQVMNGLLQTDAAINEGFSGGPLLNAYGELIGLSVSRVEGAEGIAYAIPVEQIGAALRESLLGGDAALGLWTGMVVAPAAPQAWPIVTQVHPRGPAGEAGLAVGDRILTVDRQPVSRLEQWADALLRHEAGDTLELVILRRGQSLGLSMALAPSGNRDSLGLVGAEFERGTYAIGAASGSGAQRYECPRVRRVFPDSPAARLGLRAGDLVLMIGVRDDERFPTGWAKVRSASEMFALMRGPSFRLNEDNIWIARGEETFRGVLPIDDPAVLRRARPAAAGEDASPEAAPTTVRTPPPAESASGL